MFADSGELLMVMGVEFSLRDAVKERIVKQFGPYSSGLPSDMKIKNRKDCKIHKRLMKKKKVKENKILEYQKPKGLVFSS